MAKKCNTAKYKKRRQRERLNAVARGSRIRAIEAKQRVIIQERIRKAEWEKLHDPRRIEGQKLANILYARLSSDPLYQVMEISKLFSVDSEKIMDGAINVEFRHTQHFML